MSKTKIMYVYNTYDSIIDAVENLSTHHFEENKQKLIQKIRDFRDEVPTTKEICNEFADNYQNEQGVEQFRIFIKNNPEIDEGIEEE